MVNSRENAIGTKKKIPKFKNRTRNVGKSSFIRYVFAGPSQGWDPFRSLALCFKMTFTSRKAVRKISESAHETIL